MSAEMIKIDPERYDIEQIRPAAEKLAQGGLVIFPTETVYGIGANASVPQTVERLVRIKNSPRDRNFTYHLAELDEVNKYVPTMPRLATRLARQFWPGPLTLVLPIEGKETIGLRIPGHSVARDLIRLANVPVIAPSVNLTGEPPASDVAQVIETFRDKVDIIIDSGPTKYAQSSTVVKITPDPPDRRAGNQWKILRVGAIPPEEIKKHLYQMFLFVCTGNSCRSPMVLGLFKKELAEELGKSMSELEGFGYKIVSAGTAAVYNAPATANAIAAMQEIGCDISNHLSQPVTFTMIEEADHIYVMTQGHLTTLKQWVPKAAEKTALLDPEGQDIKDPIGGSLEVYRTCREKIAKGVEIILNQLNISSQPE